MSELDPHLVKVIDKARRLVDLLVDKSAQLAGAVNSAVDYPIYVHGGNTRADVAQFVTEMEFTDDEAASHQTDVLPALVGLPPEWWSLVPEINVLREQLRLYLQQLDKDNSKVGKMKLTPYVLKQLDLTRFHRRAMARQFVELHQRPEAATYFWFSSRTIHKLDKARALKIVSDKIASLKASDTDYRDQLMAEQRRLHQLDDEVQLARIYEPTPYPRVNLLFEGEKDEVQKTAVMPVFYPTTHGQAEPELVALPSEPQPRRRKKRTDKKLDDTPVAPLVKIYRYL